MEWIERNILPDEAKGIVQVYRNYWWWCAGGDPSKALFYQDRRSDIGSPQCNSNESCSRKLGVSLGHDKRGYQLVLVPFALVPWEG